MKSLRALPLLKLALSFLGGILFTQLVDDSVAMLGLLCTPFYLICLGLDRKITHPYFEWFFAATIYGSVMGIGALSMNIALHNKPAVDLRPLNCEQIRVVGVVHSEVSQNKFGRKAIVDLAGYMDGDTLRYLPGRILVYFDQQDTLPLQRFDSLYATVYLTDLYSRYPSYLSWLKRQGVSHAAYCKARLAGSAHQSITYHLYQWQTHLSDKLASRITDHEVAGIAQAMLLGDKRGLHRETKEVFAVAGVSHILAISGLHVGIIYLMLNSLLQILHLLRYGRKLKYLLMLVLLVLYMFLTGGSPAVIRAVVMFGTILIFKIGHRRYHILNVVAASALLQMMVNPEVVFHAGFQLSYAAVTGILVLYPVFERMVETPWPLLNKVYSWMGITLVAQLSTLPLVLFHFGQFPTYFLLANMCLVLLTSAAVLAGFATVLTMGIPGLNVVLPYCAELLLGVMLECCKWVSTLPHAVISEFSWHEPGIRIIGIQLIVAVILLMLPKLKISSWIRTQAVPVGMQSAQS